MIHNLPPLLKLIGDPSRLTLLTVLASNSYCVTDLISKTGLSQSLISHHLRDLKDGGLVESEKNGRWVYYHLTPKGSQVLKELQNSASNSSPLLKLIGDESRLKILFVLKQNICCVSDLIGSTGLSQSLISHHLRDLKDGGLVESEKNGRWVYYGLVSKGQQIMATLGGKFK